METAFWIVACIVLCFIAGNKTWKIVVLEAKLKRQQDIIEDQREVINNQNVTIESYKKVMKL